MVEIMRMLDLYALFDFFDRGFGQNAFSCVKAAFAEPENVDIVFQRIGVYIDEFCIGHGFGNAKRLLLILAVSADYRAVVRIHSRCNERVNAVLLADRLQQEFGRSGADDAGALSVLRPKEGVYPLLLLLPEFHSFFFTVDKSQECEASALEFIAESEKKEDEIQQQPRREHEEPRLTQQAMKEKYRLGVIWIYGFVEIIEVEFHIRA